MDRVSEKNLKFIMDEAKSSLETQLLLVNFLQEMKEAKEGKNQSTKKQKTGQLLANTNQEKEDETPETAALGFVIPEDKALGRSGTRYSGWKKAMLLEVFAYCGGPKWSLAKRRIDSLLQCQQVFEFVFELNLTDDKRAFDRSTTTSKLGTFEALFALHQALGNRLYNMEVREGFVDWASVGFFTVEDLTTVDGREVYIRERLSKIRKVVPEEFMPHLRSDKYSNIDIASNFSYMRAHLLLSKGNHLELHTLFPKLKRSLQRTLSEDVGAAVSPNAVKTEKKAKKDKDDGSSPSLGPADDPKALKSGKRPRNIKLKASESDAEKDAKLSKKGANVEVEVGDEEVPSPPEDALPHLSSSGAGASSGAAESRGSASIFASAPSSGAQKEGQGP